MASGPSLRQTIAGSRCNIQIATYRNEKKRRDNDLIQRQLKWFGSQIIDELSDPFLRRCFCHHIPFPDEEELREIVKLHFSKIKAELLDSALRVFYDLRERNLEKPPATSELLNGT